MSIPYPCHPDYGYDMHSTECLAIELDGHLFNGKHQPGAYYGITGWSGWLDGADASGGARPHQAADGGYQTPIRFLGRSITLELAVEATTRGELWEMCNDIGRLCTTNRWSPLVVTEEALGTSRQIDVCRVRQPKITFTGWTSAVATLELQSASFPKLDVDKQRILIAPGETQRLWNVGDYPADLHIYLYGPTDKAFLAFAGTTQGSWAYNAAIAAGKQVEVLMSPRIVRDPELSKHHRILCSGSWLQLQPGESSIKYTGSGGLVAVEWRSSWT